MFGAFVRAGWRTGRGIEYNPLRIVRPTRGTRGRSSTAGCQERGHSQGLEISLKALDWAAIIGAAAWLPQVTSWVARRLATPTLRLVPSPAPEIGYTTFGPIFNLTCAISAERKDAIIERIRATLKHERGQEINLTWTTLDETFSQIRSPEGTAQVVKNQPAIALKVGTLILAERSIGFNDLLFQDQVRAQTAVAGDKLSFARTSGTPNPEQDLLRSKEFADLIALWERHFPWQEGRYTVQIEIRIVGVPKPTTQPLFFSVSANDVMRLRQNLAEIRRYEEELVVPPGIEQTYKWNWVYPQFTKPTMV